MTRSRRPVLAGSVLVALLALSACGNPTDERVAGPGDLGHIHDLVVDEDETVLMAAHTGLYRIDSVDRAVLVGSEQHDLMAMTSAGSDIVASGHPDLRLEKYRVDDHPRHLGLARSVDGGQTWIVETDLLGKHDFHALASTEAGIYAADTSGVIMLRQPDGGWNNLGELAARDLAANPGDPTHLVATDEDSTTWLSEDGARTWTPIASAPDIIEIEWAEPGRIIAASKEGALWETTRPSGPWTEIATGPSDIETLHVNTNRWWVTVHGGAVHTSVDNGKTWSPAYRPPER